MPVITSHAPGAPCWYELHTSDQAAAKQFYADVFGWTATDHPMGPGAVYTMFQVGGSDIAAACTRQSAAVRPHWLTYFHVPDVDAAAGKATELGGAVLGGPFDVADYGRMAMLRDPEGAAFALWQPKSRIGAELSNEDGTIGWSELLAIDIHTASNFYTELLGITTKPSPEYIEFAANGQSLGGFLQRYPEMQDIPPHWSFYVLVPDCDATVERVKELGGTVLYGPFEAGEVGRMAALLDPQGAKFNVIRLRAAAA